MKIRLTWLGVLLISYVLVPLFLGHNAYVMSLIVAALIIGGVALAWALLGNLGGMVSFGHAAFFGVGAYVSAILTMKWGVPVLLSILLSGVGASLTSLVMLPVLRLRGAYFALAILAYAQIFKILALEWSSLTGGAAGLSGIPTLPMIWGMNLGTKMGAYLLILTLVFVFAAGYQRISLSYYGIALRAMHDSEDATRVIGVNSGLLKGIMLLVSAFMTGMVGAFNVHYINFLEPDYAFSGVWVTLPIVAAIFGGYRTILGPLLGAITIYLLDQLLFKNLLPSGHQLVLGGLLVVVIIVSPGGVLPVLAGMAWRKKVPTM